MRSDLALSITSLTTELTLSNLTTGLLLRLKRQNAVVLIDINATIRYVDDYVRVLAPDELVVYLKIFGLLVVLNIDNRLCITNNAGFARRRAKLRAAVIPVCVAW